eukprot:GHVU01005974.1.p2 GENE.GHVU01005974.1~~GHVU01005974.1.p2  ORF type:complete len:112 (+),score=10.75 GHVU01005974.1:807-1142(+)
MNESSVDRHCRRRHRFEKVRTDTLKDLSATSSGRSVGRSLVQVHRVVEPRVPVARLPVPRASLLRLRHLPPSPQDLLERLLDQELRRWRRGEDGGVGVGSGGAALTAMSRH